MGRLKNLAKNSPAAARAGAFQYGEAATVGLSFVIALMLGTVVGWWLDKKFGWAPYGVLTGIVLGFAAGVRSMYVVLKPILKSPARTSPPSSTSAPSSDYDDRP